MWPEWTYIQDRNPARKKHFQRELADLSTAGADGGCGTIAVSSPREQDSPRTRARAGCPPPPVQRRCCTPASTAAARPGGLRAQGGCRSERERFLNATRTHIDSIDAPEPLDVDIEEHASKLLIRISIDARPPTVITRRRGPLIARRPAALMATSTMTSGCVMTIVTAAACVRNHRHVPSEGIAPSVLREKTWVT
jgi:hypothetical protein